MSKLLFIRYKKPSKIFEGGELCTQKNYNVLSRLLGQNNVDTYFIHDDTRKRTLADYIKGAFWFPFGFFFGLTPKRVDEISSMSAKYDYVFIDRSVFGIIARKLKKSHYNGKVISFFHNIEPVYFNAKIGHKPWRFIISGCAKRNDLWATRFSDSIIALNERDSKALAQHYGRKADALIPIVLDDRYEKPDYPSGQTGKKPVCLFLGTYFPPNCEGIEWFSKNVYPHVDITMKIGGKGMSRIKDNYQIPAETEIISDAPDLVPYYEEADIMVLPIFKGSGMKVKTCESLMYGKNILATDEALEGYELDYDKMGGRCNTPQDFISSIQSFIDNPRPRFNIYSRNIFLQKYSTDSIMDAFKGLLN